MSYSIVSGKNLGLQVTKAGYQTLLWLMGAPGALETLLGRLRHLTLGLQGCQGPSGPGSLDRALPGAEAHRRAQLQEPTGSALSCQLCSERKFCGCLEGRVLQGVEDVVQSANHSEVALHAPVFKASLRPWQLARLWHPTRESQDQPAPGSHFSPPDTEQVRRMLIHALS